MSALDKTPTNTNFLNPHNFRFEIKRAPHVNFFIQKANIPSLMLATVKQPTVFHHIPHPSKVDYGSFSITFKVDENFQNYLEIYDWMIALGFPDNFQQRAEIAANTIESGLGLTSDMTLLIQDSHMQTNYEVTMLDAYPIAMSEVLLDTTDPDINYTTATASFAFLKFKVERYGH